MLRILGAYNNPLTALHSDLETAGHVVSPDGWYKDSQGNQIYTVNGYSLHGSISLNYPRSLTESSFWVAWMAYKKITGVDPLVSLAELGATDQLRVIRDWIVSRPASPITQYLIQYYRRRYGANSLTKVILKQEFNIPYHRTKYDYVGTSTAIYRVLTTSRWNIYSVPPAFYQNFDYLPSGVSASSDTTIHEAPCNILEYSARTTDYLPTPEVKKKRLFGIELELEGINNEKLRRIHDVLKSHCIFKRDGSLREGVEIVSRPHTMNEHRKMFKQFFEANHGLRAENNCGIHIHTEKRGLSFLALGRLVALMNKKENQAAIIKIAGRNSQTYAKLEEANNVLTPWYSRDQNTEETRKSIRGWTKYSALNLRPEHTIEFRIFKSTTDFEEFSRFLDFAEASTDYVNNYGTTKVNTMAEFLDIKNFFQYVKERATAYPALAKFIRKELA